MSTGLANAERPSTDRVTSRRRSPATRKTRAPFPVLDASPGSLPERISSRLGNRHPVTAFLLVILAGYAALAAVTIGLGFLLTKVLLSIDWVQRADQRAVAWIVDRRTPARIDASLVGSIIAGGVVIPAVLAAVILVCALLRWWRVGAFVVFAVAVESGAYRLTTVFVHRQRPGVDRLESLPVNASFPSGHVAASIALYVRLALLISSRLKSTQARILVWIVALAIPAFVASSRMLRGMHHPTDVAAGVILGIGAVLVALLAARVAGAQAERRAAQGAGGADT